MKIEFYVPSNRHQNYLDKSLIIHTNKYTYTENIHIYKHTNIHKYIYMHTIYIQNIHTKHDKTKHT